jgi:hypothetical protein
MFNVKEITDQEIEDGRNVFLQNGVRVQNG